MMDSLPTTLPLLETERLRLREVGIKDVNALFAIYGDPEVMQYGSDGVFTSIGTVYMLLRSIERLREIGASLEWGIEVKATAGLIGTCSLHSYDPPTHSMQVGCLLARNAWGNGYMQEALLSVIQYARTLSLAALRADIDEPNIRSQRLFARLGFIPLGGTWYELKL